MLKRIINALSALWAAILSVFDIHKDYEALNRVDHDAAFTHECPECHTWYTGAQRCDYHDVETVLRKAGGGT